MPCTGTAVLPWLVPKVPDPQKQLVLALLSQEAAMDSMGFAGAEREFIDYKTSMTTYTVWGQLRPVPALI